LGLVVWHVRARLRGGGCRGKGVGLCGPRVDMG